MSKSQFPDIPEMPDMRESVPERFKAPPRGPEPPIIPPSIGDANVRLNLDKERAMIHADRGAAYGDGTEGHRNLGLEWTGILQNHYKITLPHPIPSDVVLLMMAANKLNRAACPTPLKKDNYDDAVIYVEMAREAKHDERPRCIHRILEERKGILHPGQRIDVAGSEGDAGKTHAGSDGSGGSVGSTPTGGCKEF